MSMQAPSALALLRRSAVLFVIGVGFALVLNLLQVQRKVINFPTEVISNLFTCAWWVPVFCGLAASFIGLLYPLLDRIHGEMYRQEWPAVMRCVAVFLGINHASAKIDFANNMQLTLTLTVMSVGLWYLFDRSRSGLGVALAVAALATLVTQILVYHDVYKYTEPDFLYVRSWLPCIFFSGGVTMGTIGRQLALSDQLAKQHRD